MSLKTKRLFFSAFLSRPQPSYTQIIRSGTTYYSKDRIRDLLAKRTVNEITVEDLKYILSDGLSTLSSVSYLYYLPAFLEISLSLTGDQIDSFDDSLIRSLTKPEAGDSQKVFNRFFELVDSFSINKEEAKLTKQLPSDSCIDVDVRGIRMFHERFDNISQAEGEAILFYLENAVEDFGDEVKTAIDRHWKKYRVEK